MVTAMNKIGIAKLLHTGSLGSQLSKGPEAMGSGLKEFLEELGCVLADSQTAQLAPEEEKHYGAWHRLGLASRHLGEIVAWQRRQGFFPLGLLANCNGLLGMLGGLQHSGASFKPLRVGLIWIDAHGDFNTPETTLSGMLGGMPVGVATGLCLTRLRVECGLDPALPTKYVTMVGVRDLDPFEQELLDRSEVKHISADDVRQLSPNIDSEMERLSSLIDLVYVHVDLDALDPIEVPGHGLTVKGGPTSKELGSALEMVFRHPKTAAFGIASYPAGRDSDGRTL